MPRLAHAVLYDADQKGRETLAYGFEIDGIKVSASGDAEAARAQLSGAAGEVLIAVVRAEDAAAIGFVRGLAEGERAAPPRLVLADADALPEALHGLPGPAGFLPLPAFVRDVVTAARLLAAGAAQGSDANYEGALSELGLFFIVRTMVGLHLSGVVEVERGTRKGELRFLDGEVVAAQIGAVEGQAALHQLLLWEEASLQLHFRSPARRGPSLPQGDALLDDCARFLRDFEHATRTIGHAQSLFVQDAERTASLAEAVPQELVPVMRLFDGQRNLGDVLEDSPFRVFDTLRSVARLIELGTIRRKAIEKPSTGLLQKRGREDWLARNAELTASGADAAASNRGRRSFRRKTGEHATVATGPNSPPSASPSPAPAGPAPLAAAPSPALTPTPAPAQPPRPLIEVRGGVFPRKAQGGIHEAHGELEAHQPASGKDTADVPKVLIDLGPDFSAIVPTGPQLNPPVMPPAESAPTMTPFRPLGVHAAEIDTGMRPPPPPELLAAPSPGPSIMIDPGFVEEMDAFELANSSPTPPPVAVVAPTNGAAGQAASPAPAETSGSADPVVSFVRGAALPRAGAAAATREGAGEAAAVTTSATVSAGPVVAPAAPASPAAARPGEAGAAAVTQPPDASAPSTSALAAGAVAAAAAPSPSAAAPPAAAVIPAAAAPTPAPEGSPARPPTDPNAGARVATRRASGEFDALEHEFFAREEELYHKEPVENFDDLDKKKPS